ncbi:MAG: hypothetical protein H6673_07680 [Anaerolineales bacterium]|nr:hypothetical protein [Anaerolineales bacterium]
MLDTGDMVKKAIAAYKDGKKSQARDLLTKVVDVDERNEQGWLYLSLVVDSLEEQELCLENVLSINPTNAQARKAIDVVRKKQGKPPLGDAPSSVGKMPSTPPASPPPSADPWGNVDAAWGDLASGSGRSSNSWGDTLSTDPNPWGGGGNTAPSTDSWGVGSTPEPPASTPPPATSKASSAKSPWDSGAWEAPPPPPSPPSAASEQPPVSQSPWGESSSDTGWFSDAPATSVEWGQSSGGGYHGSGQNVGSPSSSELDNWIDGLNLGSKGDSAPATPPASPSPQQTDDSLANLDWSAGWEGMGSASVFSGNAGFEQTSPFNVADLGGGAVASPDTYLKPEAKKSEPAKPAPSKPATPPPPARSRFDDDDDDDDEQARSSDRFFSGDFLDEDEEDEYADFFAMIPEEIQAPAESKVKAKAKQKSGGGSPVVVILLVLLNFAALAGLVFNLMS